MRFLFNNVDFCSRSGPNGFGLKLAEQFLKMNHEVVNADPDVVLNFIQGNIPGHRNVLRLDGIYFNTDHDWKNQNEPIAASYRLADAIIVQSEFNKELVFNYFGARNNVHVINNGTNIDLIESIPPAKTEAPRNKNWMCASSWRPHKRLKDNIMYFLEFADDQSTMYVAGSGDLSGLQEVKDRRVKYVGDLPWNQLISLMKSCSNFVHLAYLDHCPNVVVDARAAGCKIHCSSTGGTKEVVGSGAEIVLEEAWDFKPTALYRPPSLDFHTIKVFDNNSNIDIKNVAEKYANVLKG